MRSGFACGLVFIIGTASAQTEFTSQASWNGSVNGITTYTITPPPGGQNGSTSISSVIYGPGTFTPIQPAFVNDDGLYGAGVTYVSSEPAFCQCIDGPAVVSVSFSAAADITALAFDVGANNGSASINLSVNGSALAPVEVSNMFPTAFVGVTDKSPITSVVFSEATYLHNNPIDEGEVDVVGSYHSANAVAAPEIDSNGAASGIALLFGGMVVMNGRKLRRITQ